MSPHVVVIVPCFNEARRLDVAAIGTLIDDATDVLVVDDGSTDDTAAVAEAAGLRVVRLPHNVGKGEAVRHGLRHALDGGAAIVGYLDADLSTPITEYRRLIAALVDDATVDVILGSRIAHLGAHIERRAARHYLGRLFATSASLALGLAVYDTQCGAKVFRNTAALRASLHAPFTSRWAFDVELLARLLDAGLAPARLREVPLRAWRDIAGSHLSLPGMATAAKDVLTLALRRRRH